MDAGIVEDLVGVGDPQEPGALLIRLLADLRHFQDLFARGELAVFLPIGDDVLRRRRADAREVGKERTRGGVEVDADGVHAVLDHPAERLVQAGLLHIVLILTDPDRARLDLDQFRQGILQTAGNRDGAPLGHVEVGKLLGAEFGRRIDRRARLADDDVFHVAVGVRNDLARDEPFALARRGAVADGDDVDAVFFNERKDDPTAFLDLLFRDGRIDDRGL